jgi:hypothetical protein
MCVYIVVEEEEEEEEEKQERDARRRKQCTKRQILMWLAFVEKASAYTPAHNSYGSLQYVTLRSYHEKSDKVYSLENKAKAAH